MQLVHVSAILNVALSTRHLWRKRKCLTHRRISNFYGFVTTSLTELAYGGIITEYLCLI